MVSNKTNTTTIATLYDGETLMELDREKSRFSQHTRRSINKNVACLRVEPRRPTTKKSATRPPVKQAAAVVTDDNVAVDATDDIPF